MATNQLSYLTKGLLLVAVLLVLPAGYFHLFAPDAGLPMFTNGQKTLDTIDTSHLHLCALLANAEFVLYGLMIVMSMQPSNQYIVAIFYAVYMAGATILQFTHPMMGEAPAGLTAMPMPLLYVMVGLVLGGYMMDKKKNTQENKDKSK